MSESRTTTPNDLYFVTLTITAWIDLFTRPVYKDLVIENLQYCQTHEKLDIYCYVLMTNHLHMICSRRENDLKELLGRFKSYTSKQLLKAIESNIQESRKEWLLHQFRYNAKLNRQYSEYHLWEYTNHPVEIYTLDVYYQKQDYIHDNPVRAGIVVDPSAYLYSSACKYSPLKVERV